MTRPASDDGRLVEIGGTSWRWRVLEHDIVVLELRLTPTLWHQAASFGPPTLAAVCVSGARLAAELAPERRPERGGGAAIEG